MTERTFREKLAIAAIVLLSASLGGFIVGYGALSVINGVAILVGIGQPVDIHVVAEHDEYSRYSADVSGEFQLHGEQHRIGLSDGEEGEVLDGMMAPLPYVDFRDEPMVSLWDHFARIVGGLFCLSIVLGPWIWCLARRRRSTNESPTDR